MHLDTYVCSCSCEQQNISCENNQQQVATFCAFGVNTSFLHKYCIVTIRTLLISIGRLDGPGSWKQSRPP